MLPRRPTWSISLPQGLLPGLLLMSGTGWRNLDHWGLGRSFFLIGRRLWSSTPGVGLLPKPKPLQFLEPSSPSSCWLSVNSLCISYPMPGTCLPVEEGYHGGQGRENTNALSGFPNKGLLPKLSRESQLLLPWFPDLVWTGRFPLKGQSRGRDALAVAFSSLQALPSVTPLIRILAPVFAFKAII